MNTVMAMASFAGQALLGFVLLLCATLAFDAIHVLLHKFAARKHRVLAKIGALHTVHHEFLDRRLCLHENKLWANVFHHVLPEFVVQVMVTLALAPLLPAVTVWTALLLETGVLIFILWGKPGIDVNHKQVEKLLPYRPLYFCVPEYHLLHHVYPDAHFSSWIKTLDHWLGTGLSLTGRTVLMTEPASPLSRALMQVLSEAGCRVRVLDLHAPVQQRESLLAEAGILLLNHDLSGQDYPAWCDYFYATHRDDRLPVEVWELLDEGVSAQQSSKRAQEQFSRQAVIYRQCRVNTQAPANDVAYRVLTKLRRGDNLITVR